MRRKIFEVFLPLALIVSFLCMGAMQTVDTMETIWVTPLGGATTGTIDSTAAAADIALAVGERSFTLSKTLDNFVYAQIRQGINAVEFRFKLTTNNADVDIDIYGVRTGDDNMIKIGTLDVIAGQQTEFDSTGTATGLVFADTITWSSTTLFLKTTYSAIPGVDQCARGVFDACGYEYIGFHGYGTFDEDCAVEFSGF